MNRFAHGWLSERDILPQAKLRLFCLPHAGSGAAGFYRWKRSMPAGIDVCPVLLPGREARMAERPLENAVELVDAMTEAVAPYLDVPFAIFGHSMGALLAYEWALRLTGRPLVCMFVSGRDAAHMPSGHRDLHLLDDASFLEELRRRYRGMAADLLADAELREIFLPVLRSDLRLVETYRPKAQPLLHSPVTAFAGAEDFSVSESGLLGWGELTRGPFEARRLPGDHFFHIGAGQPELVRAIGKRLG